MKNLTLLNIKDLEATLSKIVAEQIAPLIAQNQPQHQEGGDELFTINEVSKLLKFTRPTIYKYMKKGLLKPLRIDGAIRFHKKDIDNFMKQK